MMNLLNFAGKIKELLSLVWSQHFSVAFQSIRSHLLRTILTILIIAVGITALVGILTAIDAIKASITSNFTSMGANTFTIRNRGSNIRIGNSGKKPKVFKRISYEDAIRFKDAFNAKGATSISGVASYAATLKHKSNKSNPNITIFGADENYLKTSGYDLESGRNFSPQELQYNASVTIIGKSIVDMLFIEKEDPLGKFISVGSGKYQVIGILKEKGSSMGFGGDKNCLIPINNMRQYFSKPDMSYVINILAESPELLNQTIGEAIGIFRIIRRVALNEEENFEIIKSDNLASMLIDNIKYVTAAATVIGLITLLGAAIGLMNIMLVSVTERTKEIGTRKAMGATKKTIKNQFLIEAIVICQLGGLLGIVLGILIGNIMSMIIGGGFIIPWAWIITGVVLCFFTGVISGYYPATRAANLDPIEALRAE
jgi:putative ABC transport system permease protein